MCSRRTAEGLTNPDLSQAKAVPGFGGQNGRENQARQFSAAHSDEAGRSFRSEAGHDSDLKPAAIPI